MTADNDKSQPHVFISYRREDMGQVVSRLVADLVSVLGWDGIFYDRESLEGGDQWKERPKEEISQCSVFLALIGKEWLLTRNKDSGQRRPDEPNDWVRSELELALERSTEILIVPLRVDDTKMPERRFLPPSIQGILDHQAVPLRTATTNEWNTDIQALLARMEHKGLVPPSGFDCSADWKSRRRSTSTSFTYITGAAHSTSLPSTYAALRASVTARSSGAPSAARHKTSPQNAP